MDNKTVAKMYWHQGWTDIINSLPLLNYHHNNYDELQLVVRQDAKELIDYYISQFDNVSVTYLDKKILDCGPPWNEFKICDQDDILYTGYPDGQRTDQFQNAYKLFDDWSDRNFLRGGFVEGFYTPYNIDYKERVNSFGLKRNIELENSIFDKFIINHNPKNEDYIIVHEYPMKGIYTNYPKNGIKVFNINRASNTFFDFIKILQNAKSIYLIDSSWAAICYLIDARYNILKDIEVTVCCARGYDHMFTKPVKLNNWIIQC